MWSSKCTSGTVIILLSIRPILQTMISKAPPRPKKKLDSPSAVLAVASKTRTTISSGAYFLIFFRSRLNESQSERNQSHVLSSLVHMLDGSLFLIKVLSADSKTCVTRANDPFPRISSPRSLRTSQREGSDRVRWLVSNHL